MKIVKINIKKLQRKKIEEVAEIIKKGGVVIFPTDTVYGLGASAFDKDAISRIYKIKGREKRKPLILFLRYEKDLYKFITRIPKEGHKFIKKFWPGPLTLIFNASKELPGWLKDERNTIGIRIPDHPVALALIKSAGPLATTSANISGFKSAVTIADISKKLSGKVDIVIDAGAVPIGKESTILDLTQKPFRTLREGAVKIQGVKG